MYSTSKAYLAVFIFVAVAVLYVEADLYCFKKIHSVGDGGARRHSICRGMLNRSKSGTERLFRSRKGCCKNGGVGFAEGPLVTSGRRNLKFQCTRCRGSMDPLTEVVTTQPTTTHHPDGWSTWGAWSPCSVTCAVGHMSRERSCHTNCGDGESTEYSRCMLTPDCPVDGAWGPWNDWSSCPTTCDGVNRTRYRRCNDPVPQYGGRQCDGERTEVAACGMVPCPVNGGWSEWVTHPCSATCGKGVIIRNRTCDSPAPKHGGASCEGPSNSTESCPPMSKCPVHGDWALWNEWSACSGTCGQGQRIRRRKCAAPKPKHGGDPCVGDSAEQDLCSHPLPCPVDGGWTSWEPWSACLAEPCTGDQGYTIRRRTCKNPLPQYGGETCDGNSTQIETCTNNDSCPVNGGWCEWLPFTECPIKGGIKLRTRDCGCPPPESGGLLCQGGDIEVSRCLTDVELRCRDRLADPSLDAGSGGFDDDADC